MSSNLESELKPLAIAQTRNGIRIIAREQKVISARINIDKVLKVNWRAFSLLCICFLKRGIKAALNAPSAKNLRNMFGKEKAIIKASPTGPEPRNAARRISLINPNIRLTNVQIPTV